MIGTAENHASTAFWASITLPPLVRYWDDISLEYRSIRDLTKSDIWSLTINGRAIDFTKIDSIYRTLCKRWLADLFTEASPTTVLGYFESVMTLGASKVGELIRHLKEDHPSTFRTYWLTDLHPCLSVAAVRGVRSLCRTFCRHGYGHWTPEHLNFVSELKGYPVDKYTAVRRGDCFVDFHDQSRIIQYLNGLAAHIAITSQDIDTETLRSAIILALSYQHGLRAGQIARIKTSSVTFFLTGAVHFKFPVTKQRANSSAEERLRTVRREWCPIFVAFGRRSN